LDDLTIKIRTGFPTVMMIAFIVITAEGITEKIEKTTSKLTWLEEWICYFEI
jgi:hypothetical protein